MGILLEMGVLLEGVLRGSILIDIRAVLTQTKNCSPNFEKKCRGYINYSFSVDIHTYSEKGLVRFKNARADTI